MGRFISADVFVSTGQGILGNNMFAYCRNNPVSRIDVTGMADAACYGEDGELLSSDDIESHNGGGGGSRFTSHFGNSSSANKPWYSIIESPSAYNATKGLKYDQYQSYEDVLTKLAQGDGTGLNLHKVDGHWSADISGFGKGRGRARVLFDILDGIIYIFEVSIKHYKK